MRLKRFAFLVLAALCIGVAGCGPLNIGSSFTVAPTLAEALTFAPVSNVTFFAFTDWTLIKTYEGAQNVTSKSSEADRNKFLSSLVHRQAPASGFGLDYIYAGAAQTWSFDTTDYSWEATVNAGDNPPGYVVKLRDDFDLSPVIAHFKDRGFTTSSYRGVTIYSHESGLKAIETDWFGPYAFGILNCGIMTNEKMLVCSPGVNMVHQLLDAHAGATANMASDSAVQDFTKAMGTVFSAMIEPGTFVCSRLTALPASMQATLQDDLSGATNLHTYSWLGASYHYEQQHPTGLIGLHFASSGDASADEQPRRKIAETGVSLASHNRYSSDVFTVDSTSTQGGNLLLHASPVNGEPNRLFEMFSSDDLAFGACPA